MVVSMTPAHEMVIRIGRNEVRAFAKALREAVALGVALRERGDSPVRIAPDLYPEQSVELLGTLFDEIDSAIIDNQFDEEG